MRFNWTPSRWLQNWHLNPRTSHLWIRRLKLITEIRRLNKVTSKTWMHRALVALLLVAFIRQLVQGLEPLHLVELGDVHRVLLHLCSLAVPWGTGKCIRVHLWQTLEMPLTVKTSAVPKRNSKSLWELRRCLSSKLQRVLWWARTTTFNQIVLIRNLMLKIMQTKPHNKS